MVASARCTTAHKIASTMSQRSHISLSFLGLLVLLALQGEYSEAADCEIGLDGECLPTHNNVLECGVYMAPSTLGEDVSMGIYTGKDIKTDDVINFSEIAIPFLFREWGNHVANIKDGELWDRYIWEGPIMDIETYTDTNRHDSRAVFVPGVGCTVNSILDMHNIHSTHGSVYDTAGLHRAKDPGTGAFCPYHSAETTAAKDIVAGSELFAEYGDYWIPDIPGAQVLFDDLMIRAEDFLQDDYLTFVQDHPKLSTEAKEDLYELVKNFPIKNQVYTTLPRNVPWSKVEDKLKELNKKDEDRTTDEGSAVRDFVVKQHHRSIDWLNRRGYCQDHIYPKNSEIPQAGRGAFATRDLPKGTIVGYSPLVHMGTRGLDILDIEFENDDGSTERHAYDLVINYSFDHANSTVMLTPYGGMVNFINHSPKPNVAVRWPNKRLIAHLPEYLEYSPEKLADVVEKIGLSFEYVALRDIAKDEEVVMDYGPEWQKAWDAHVQSWKPVEDAEKYVHTTDWKETDLRTAEELKTNPYPPNFITMCRSSYKVNPETGENEWLPVLRDHGPHRMYCEVIGRKQYLDPDKDNEEVTRYTVKIQLDENDDNSWVEVTQVPRDEIFLYDGAFTQDWHLPNVFRQPIGIPDSILPDAWRNGPKVAPF